MIAPVTTYSSCQWNAPRSWQNCARKNIARESRTLQLEDMMERGALVHHARVTPKVLGLPSQRPWLPRLVPIRPLERSIERATQSPLPYSLRHALLLAVGVSPSSCASYRCARNGCPAWGRQSPSPCVHPHSEKLFHPARGDCFHPSCLICLQLASSDKRRKQTQLELSTTKEGPCLVHLPPPILLASSPSIREKRVSTSNKCNLCLHCA